MSHIMDRPPPPPPPVSAADDDPAVRVHFRLWQICMSAVTVLAAAWLFTVHIVAGIVGLFFAKHVLVALLAAGLNLPPKNDRPRG